MKHLRYSILIFFSVFLLQAQFLFGLGMSSLIFKNVGSCFKPGKVTYAPMFGSIALSSGFIEAMRFYNVIPGQNNAAGDRVYALDSSIAQDPFMEMILLLFPSSGGQLTAVGAGNAFIGNYLDEEDVACLVNFVYQVRLFLLQNNGSLEEKGKSKKSSEKKGKNLDPLDVRRFGLDYQKLSKKSSEKKYKNNIDIFIKSIMSALQSEWLEFSHEQKAVEGEAVSERAKEKEEENESKVQSIKKSFLYPPFMVEQILGAFFCYKYGTQASLKKFLGGLSDEIIDRKKIDEVEGLLDKQDLEFSLKKIESEDLLLDDAWIILNQDIFDQILPYRNGESAISNGMTKHYCRKDDLLSGEKNVFADCVEVSIRHVMNCIFFNRMTKQFDLSRLDVFMEGKDQRYIQNLKKFYEKQTPELANAGDADIRSLWNAVVADLGPEITYKKQFNSEQNNNEIKSGMLNFVHVFEKIFGLSLSGVELNQDDEEVFVESVSNQIKNCLESLFKELSPNKIECQVDIKNRSIFDNGYGKKDLAGSLVIQVVEPESGDFVGPGDPGFLFNFTVRVISIHVQFENLKLFQPEIDPGFKEKLPNLINDLYTIPYTSSFFFHPLLFNEYQSKLPLYYQIFRGNLNDTDGKLLALDRLHDLCGQLDQSFVEQIVQNLLNQYLWDDMDSVQRLSNKMYNKESSYEQERQQAWSNDLFIAIVKKYVKGLYFMCSDTIKELDLSEFNLLKKINCLFSIYLTSIKGSLESLEEMDLGNSPVKSLDIDCFPNLKKLKCMKSVSIKGDANRENLILELTQ